MRIMIQELQDHDLPHRGKLSCDECNQEVPLVVQLGFEPPNDTDDYPFYELCPACAEDMIKMIKNHIHTFGDRNHK